MIIYSEGHHDSLERNFGHTISALWKAMSQLVAVMAPTLLVSVSHIRLYYLHSDNYLEPFSDLEIMHAFSIKPSTELGVRLHK